MVEIVKCSNCGRWVVLFTVFVGIKDYLCQTCGATTNTREVRLAIVSTCKYCKQEIVSNLWTMLCHAIVYHPEKCNPKEWIVEMYNGSVERG